MCWIWNRIWKKLSFINILTIVNEGLLLTIFIETTNFIKRSFKKTDSFFKNVIDKYATLLNGSPYIQVEGCGGASRYFI